MRCIPPGDYWKRGSSSGTLIWLVILIGAGLIVREEFFAEEKVSVDGVSGIPASYGKPVSKTTIPRPR